MINAQNINIGFGIFLERQLVYSAYVELSHRTGQITHHIDADIDQERDNVIKSIEKTHQIAQLYQVTGIGATWVGRNRGGAEENPCISSFPSAQHHTTFASERHKPHL